MNEIKVETQSKYSLLVEVGSIYTGNAFESKTETTYISSDIEPVRLYDFNEKKYWGKGFLVRQNGKPVLIEVWEEKTDPNSNKTTWYNVGYRVYEFVRGFVFNSKGTVEEI